MDKFNNKNALITGGSSGIGLSVAKKMAQLGTNVWILARRPDQLQLAKLEIEKFRINQDQVIDTISLDIANCEMVLAEIGEFIKKYGAPDYLVNSAGVAHPGRFDELDIKIFRWMMETNYFGLVNMIKAVIPGMIQRKAGHIINISSVAGFSGVYGYTAYGASKFAVTGLSDTLRAEMKPLGIKISVVFPPDTDTPQHDYEKQYQPEITKNLNKNAKMVTPDKVADAIIKGINRGKYIITPGFDTTLLHLFTRQMGIFEYRVMDFLVNQAAKDSDNKIPE
jgi:3-dehydrosphinganine reductase